MIIVIGASRAHPSQEWVQLALGEEDQYGNQFELVELRWNNNRLHLMADYAKTRGFEDAVITAGSGGGLTIKYRRPGSAMWYRPNPIINRFVSQVAKTPHNIKVLATHYRDKLWRIASEHIDKEVRALSDKLWAEMSSEEQLFNEKRIEAMYTHSLEKGLDGANFSRSPESEKQDMREEKRLLFQKEKELREMEARIAKQQKRLTDEQIKTIEEGKQPIQYHEKYLMGMKFSDLRKAARKLGIQMQQTTKKTEVVEMILAKQDGVVLGNKNPELEQDPGLTALERVLSEKKETVESVTD